MQTEEFNKLYDEKYQGEIKAFQPVPNSMQLNGLMNYLNSQTPESLEKAKALVKANEKPLTKDDITKIRNFITAQREKHIKERTIKRMVKRQFGIIVLPE